MIRERKSVAQQNYETTYTPKKEKPKLKKSEGGANIPHPCKVQPIPSEAIGTN